MDTIRCFNGLTVTNAASGEVLFSQKSATQCKIHNFCQTITLTSTDANTNEQSKSTLPGKMPEYLKRLEISPCAIDSTAMICISQMIFIPFR